MCFALIALSNTTGNNLKRCLLLPRFKEKWGCYEINSSETASTRGKKK